MIDRPRMMAAMDAGSQLSVEEVELRKAYLEHPVTATEILKEVPALHDALPLIRHHHEWFDGNGYPEGLKDEAITYLAHILSIVDAYSAMASDRPQRRAMKPFEAHALINAGSGKQFDPRIVAEFICMMEG